MDARNSKIAKNTGFLYFRSIVCLFLSLYSSRLILQALGVEDFGIYNAVGGLASMFWIVSSTLSTAVGRYMNYEVGNNNQTGVNEVFSISLNIMIVLSIIVVILSESVGLWFLSNKMTIPADRMMTALLIFHLSVFSVVLGFIAIPFSTAINVHEKMGFVAFYNIVEIVFKLIIALVLTVGSLTINKLFLYAILMTVNTVFVYSLIYIYAWHNFQECRFRCVMRKKKLIEMFRFAWWNFISSISETFSNQGINMVLNVTHGPILNTARGITDTVTKNVSLLVYNFNVSTNPQLMQSYAAGDLHRVRYLSFRGTQFASYLMFLFLIPLCFETSFTIYTWLGIVPEHTVAFIRLSLIASLFYVFDYTFVTVKLATGDIKRYKLTISLLTFMNFPLSFLVLTKGMIPELIYVIPVFVAFIKVIVTLFFVRRALNITLSDLFHIYRPIVCVFFVAVIPSFYLHISMDEGWLRFILTIFVSVFCTVISAFFIGCDKKERKMIVNIIKQYCLS